MVGGDFSVCLLGVLDQVAGFAANFLPQGATEGYGHNLETSTDAKDGLFEPIDFAKQEKLKSVSGFANFSKLGVWLFTKEKRIDIFTTSKEKSVNRLGKGFDNIYIVCDR